MAVQHGLNYGTELQAIGINVLTPLDSDPSPVTWYFVCSLSPKKSRVYPEQEFRNESSSEYPAVR